MTKPLSSGYQRWRRQFLLTRIPLACGVGIALQLFFLVVEVAIEAPLAEATRNASASDMSAAQWLPFYEAGLGISMLLLIWLLLKVPRIRRAPARLIWLFPLAFLLIPKLPDLFWLTPDNFNVNIVMLIVFIYQAILLPVYWRSQLISQAIAISLLPLCFTWIIGSQWSERQAQGQVTDGTLTQNLAILFTFLSLQLVMAAVALLIVWVQERFWIREIDLRDRLQLLLHAISHDLRPAAMGSVMLLQQLQDKNGDIEVSPPMLQQMLEGSHRQLKLVNSLTAAYANHISLHKAPVYIQAFIADVLQKMQPLLERGQTNVVLLIDDHIPPIHVDALQLRRVYENLITNAIQHNSIQHEAIQQKVIEQNTKGLQLTITASVQGRYLYCTMQDNGIGIAPERIQQLFDPYSLRNRQPLHLGLGLYICQQIITAHKGKIGVSTPQQKGTLFWFTLPLTD